MKKLVALCLGASLLFNNVESQRLTGDEPPAKRQRVIKSEEAAPFYYWSQDRLNRWLLQAAKEGKSELVDKLLSGPGLRANVNAIDKFGRTALVYAALAGHGEIVKQLLLYGAYAPNPAEVSEATSVLIGHYLSNMTNYLNQKYPEIFVEGKDLWNLSQAEANQLLVEEAAHRGDLRLVIRLLYGPGMTASVDFRTKDYGETALMLAVIQNHLDIVRALIAAGADVNSKDNDGITALMKAAIIPYDVKGVLDQLIAAGADVDAFDNTYTTALLYAVKFGKIDVTRVLIAAGADVDAFDNTGKTALMYAAMKGDEIAIDQPIAKDLIDQLIAAGADVDANDDTGKTALIFAVMKNHFDLAQQLINRGADVNRVDYVGWSPLLLAAQNQDASMVTLLLTNDASIPKLEEMNKVNLSQPARQLLRRYKHLHQQFPPHTVGIGG